MAHPLATRRVMTQVGQVSTLDRQDSEDG